MLSAISKRLRLGLLIPVVAVSGLFALPYSPVLHAQDSGKDEAGKRKKNKKGKKEKEEVEEKPATMADAIGNVTPIGRGHSDLVIPQFDPETGNRSSTIQVRKVEREDEVSLRLQGLQVQEFGPDGTETMRIEVRSGNFDLTTGILTGDSYSKVSVPGQFEIVGAGLICDTTSKKIDDKVVRADVGTMKGPVRMIIFGGGKMSLTSGGKEKKEPAKKK